MLNGYARAEHDYTDGVVGCDEADLRVGELQRALYAVLENVRRIDPRTVECESPERLSTHVLPTVRAAIEQSIIVFNAVIDHHERDSAVPAADSSGVFHDVFEGIVACPRVDDPRQRVADVAFMARWELIRKLDALELGEQLEPWDLIGACGSALRRAVKAIGGVESVLADVEGCPSLCVGLYQTQSEEAALIRGAYEQLIARLHDIEQQQQRLGIARCLRLVGIALASLIGDDIYAALRSEDRRMVRGLQRRLIDWLRGERGELDGQRLLGDACALASLLMETNQQPDQG